MNTKDILNIDEDVYQWFAKTYSADCDSKIVDELREFIKDRLDFNEEYDFGDGLDSKLIVSPFSICVEEIEQWFALYDDDINNTLKKRMKAHIKEHMDMAHHQIRYLWGRAVGGNVFGMPTEKGSIRSIEDEIIFMEKMRSVFVYPDYLSLVSNPSQKNWGDNGVLSIERKAELLLIGCYSWDGVWIAKNKPFPLKDDIGWLICADTSYQPERELEESYVMMGRKFDSYRRREYQNYKFIPLHNCSRVESLARVLYPSKLTSDKKPFYKDGNPHNLNESNIFIKSKAGKPMRCKRCGKETIREQSRLLDKKRYCNNCLSGKNSKGFDVF